MALDSDSPTITTLVPSAGVPLSLTTDQSLVYFIDGTVTAALCAPNMAIKRVPLLLYGPLEHGLPQCALAH
jgi:hypothetical protein